MVTLPPGAAGAPRLSRPGVAVGPSDVSPVVGDDAAALADHLGVAHRAGPSFAAKVRWPAVAGDVSKDHGVS